ncbi:hypothetical protein [Chitinimonas sp. BJYL2]|uniref:hypothetical protein n=1 Tax=Chitinimonas sp. BJYL2 TaxID=2976696 RepID=UPI0022B493DB|nr:hypothetical protein [Chitinimonas sp. BJYL2]
MRESRRGAAAPMFCWKWLSCLLLAFACLPLFAASHVTFLSPAVSGAEYVNGFNISVKVTSPDIVKVKLSADGFPFGNELNAANNWTIFYTFSNLGTRNLVATGYDASGTAISTTTSSISVVNIKVVDPAKNATYSNGTPASIAASAAVTKVLMLADSYQIGAATARDSNGQFVITPAYLNTIGARTFRFQGFNAAGIKIDERQVPVYVVNLTFANPGIGASFVLNDVVTAQVNAAGNVARVDYYADSYFWGSSTDRASLFKISQPVTIAGSRVLYAKAYNASGTLLSTNSLNFTVTYPGTSGGGQNKWGVWLFEFERVARMATTHEQLAAKLRSMGVKRIYIKVADGTKSTLSNGYTFPLFDARVPAAYKAQGIEPWAWAYNYPANRSSPSGQGETLYQAAKSGYVGFVSDIETEFETASVANQVAVFQAFSAARQRAINDGYATSAFKLYETSFGYISYHSGVAISAIDPYVDGHMPQTYTVYWGSSAEADQAGQIAYVNQQYRNLGATKPIHHITSIERHFDSNGTKHEMTVPRLQTFMEYGGAEASIWVLPEAGDGTGEQDVPYSSWNLLTGINWTANAR